MSKKDFIKELGTILDDDYEWLVIDKDYWVNMDGLVYLSAAEVKKLYKLNPTELKRLRESDKWLVRHYKSDERNYRYCMKDLEDYIKRK